MMKLRLCAKLRVYFYLGIIVSFNFLSCYKKINCDCPLPVDQRSAYLIEFTWGLISANSIDSLSSGILRRYKGVRSDSLHFLWSLNTSLNISAFCSFIQGNGDSIIANINSINSAVGVKINDTSTIAYDTVITASPWRPNYSDTLFISKVSPTALVFRVSYADANGKGVEIDSFRNAGPFMPF
jgi:hypothetical protein